MFALPALRPPTVPISDAIESSTGEAFGKGLMISHNRLTLTEYSGKMAS